MKLNKNTIMSSSNVKTKYFQNCMGVFQGGGCKGSAYVGAYREAFKWGVSFSELVGTSAGSIIAVLIGAGATPKQIEEIFSELDFKKFLNNPKTLQGYKPTFKSLAFKYYNYPFLGKYKRLVNYLGLHSSEYIRVWLNLQLSKLLPHISHPVKFEDLIIPTNVVTTDLYSKRIKVYSQEKTPTFEVAEAVQASCNIPGIFQPLNMQYVDGGLLSNLPAFIFDGRTDRLYNRILAFSLESEPSTNKFSSLEGYSKAILDTTLEGNLDLQIGLQEDLHIIKINTGTILATDFEKINPTIISMLINQGENAVKNFFRNETTEVNTGNVNLNLSLDYFKTNNFIVETSNFKYKEIIISDINSEWSYEIFPTLLKWKDDGAKIVFFLDENRDQLEHTKFRQRFLNYFGVQVILTNHIPFSGFIFDGADRSKAKAIILNRSEKKPVGCHSKLYLVEEDFYAIKYMRKRILELGENKLSKASNVQIEKVKPNELFDLLKNIPFYSHDDIDMSIRDIKVTDVFFITKYVRGYKYRQIHTLFDLYKKFGLALFEPAKLKLDNGKYTLITPPIVEKIGDKMFLVQGNTRFAYAYRNNIETLKCVFIEGIKDPLPSKSEINVKEVLLSDKVVAAGTRYDKFDLTKFREIEKAIRNPEICLL